MTIASFQLDPNAVPYTDDEIVGKVNSADANISRAGSVLAAARPIAAGEIGATELEHEAFLAAEKTKLGDVEKGARDLKVISDWVASTVYALGDIVRPTAPNDCKYVCTVAGTSGASEPTWGTVEGGETVDATVTWTCWSYVASTVDADKLVDGVTNKAFTATEDTKLAGVEANAKDDQSGAEIKTAYEGEANTYNDTKDTKLGGIAEGAEVNPADLAGLDSVAATKLGGIDEGAKDDQTGAEIRDAVVALADTERKFIVTNPLSGEFKVTALQRNSSGELDIDYDDVPEP